MPLSTRYLSLVNSKFVGHHTNSEDKSHIGSCLHFYHTHTRTDTHTITHVSKELWFMYCVETNFCCCSVTKSCPGLCDPMDCSTSGFPVFHCLPEFAQIYVHWVNDVIWAFHPLPLPSPFACSLSQHQSLFQWADSLQLQNQSIQWIFRVDFLSDWLV